MRILILGGTIFLGRHLAEAAVARGHALTLFHRGQHTAGSHPGVEMIHGNRDPREDGGRGLGLLGGRRWDAVIDTCGYVPRVVRASAEALAGAVEQYVFISTISVYPHFRQPGTDEHAPTGTLADPALEEVTGDTYGPLKALCEAEAERVFGPRALIIRPGLIVGPHDPTDRFTYWVQRVADGGTVLAPAPPERQVQVVDARDLAEWTIRMVEARASGTYNATGPAAPLTIEQVFETCRVVSGSDAQFVWAGERWLLEHEVEPWIGLPLWVPSDDPDMLGFSAIDCGKAIGAGLAFRQLEATVRDTLAWCRARPAEYSWRAGLDRAREEQLLAEWSARQ